LSKNSADRQYMAVVIKTDAAGVATFSAGAILSSARTPGEGVASMINLTVNGTKVSVPVEGDMPLLWVIRDVLGLTGTKFGCGIGQCGACTVHVDGEPRRSCLTPVSEVADSAITTIEGIGATKSGKAVQDAWLGLEVVQCGYCQSGQIMTAAAIIDMIPEPTDTDIDQGMSGNICRCGTYVRIREAVKQAAKSAAGK
jgi:isoquinoline 1-oxidoreductase alpha subunit